ncbi:MAG: DUF3598 family protein [Cyanobacteria bacterium P01_F01_bin.42]
MSTQWQGLLKNLGCWTGTFADYSPEGVLSKEVPSELTLALSDDQQQVDLCLNRYPEAAPVSTIQMQFSHPGPGPLIPFFESGPFSQGALQYSSFSRFGAELAMIWGDRRLRIVQQYPLGPEWSGLTLICESRADLPPSPQLTLADLTGEWEGEAQTLTADFREPSRLQTRLVVEQRSDRLHQSLVIGEQTIQSSGQISGSRVDFESAGQSMRLLLLPGGGSSLCPPSITSGHPFFLEAGWLIEPNLRQRLIRRYRASGEWESLTLVTERRKRP